MRKRRAVVLSLALVAVAVVGLVLGFGPLVRAKARAQAERRGAVLEIATVRPGWGRVWLRDVVVAIPDVPSAELHLDAVEVQIGASLSPSGVRIHGGNLRLRGSVSEVMDQVAAWRAKRRGEGGGRGSSVVLDGLHVSWSELAPDAEPLEVWGARLLRDGERELVELDLCRGRYGGVAWQLENASAELGRQDGRRVLKQLKAGAASLTVDLDSELARRVMKREADGTGPPRESPSKGESEAALSPKPGRVERDARGPKVAARDARTSPAGSSSSGEPWLAQKLIDPERGPRVRRMLSRAAAAAAELIPLSGELDLSGLGLKLERGGDSLSVGPGRLRVVRGADAISVALAPAPSAEHALGLALELPLGAKEVRASVNGGPVSLATLGVQEGDFGLREVDKALLEAQGNATLSADGRELAWVGSGKLGGVSLEKPWLAPGRVRGLTLGLSGKGRAALDGSRFNVEEAELSVGKVRVELKGQLEQTREHQKLWLDGGVPLASCQAMLDSAPEGLLPLLSGMRATGTFSLTGRLELDTRDVESMVTRWSVANECRISEVPAEVSPRKFAQTWTREVLDASGRPTQIQSGPGTVTWVPRDAISRHMETAILICEDAAFFRHRGFDQEAIRNSIRENVKTRRFVRGASTVSMQLAKNLYLSRAKTLSRKLQEAVLTQLLEQELSKDQILELYLNVVEFGPGIYGIGPAAAYYFNSTASQLSLGQALYLASILPNPKRQYFGADGAVTPGWSAYLRKLMRIAHKIRRVDDRELEEALTEQVTFKQPYSPRVPVEGEGPEDEPSDPVMPLQSEQTVE